MYYKMIIVGFLLFIINGCSSEDKFLPDTLPVAKVGQPYNTHIALPSGKAVFCDSFYVSIDPPSSWLTVKYIDPGTTPLFCGAVDIHGTPKTIQTVSITLTGGGPMPMIGHAVRVKQTYVIKVE